MFDKVPIHVWILLWIAAVGYIPARSLFRHWRGRSLPSGINAEAADLLTGKQLARAATMIFGLLCLAIFIFTPAAVQMVRSPSFWPIALAALSLFAIDTVFKGFMTGRIEPMTRGTSWTFERSAQPKRFWASMIWNGSLGCMMLWVALAMPGEQVDDRCHDRQDKLDPKEVVAACDKLIREGDEKGKDLADLLSARGYAYHRQNDLNNAINDYTKAIELDSEDSYTLYNRGLIRHRIDDLPSALEDFNASLRLRPDNFNGYVNRAGVLFDMKRYDEARADWTKAHEMQPKDMKVLAMRGVTYGLKGDRAHAEQDFAAVLALEPDNQIVKQAQRMLAGLPPK